MKVEYKFTAMVGMLNMLVTTPSIKSIKFAFLPWFFPAKGFSTLNLVCDSILLLASLIIYLLTSGIRVLVHSTWRR